MPVNRIWIVFWLFIALTVSNLDSALAQSVDSSATSERQLLDANDFQPWQWLQSDCNRCELYILRNHPDLQTEKVAAFTLALKTHKFEIMELYKIHGAEYNLLAHMAIGILGRESLFFTSTRYKIKETFPWAISMLKVLRHYLNPGSRSPDNNSRGPTQIKIVPTKIAETYKVTAETLYQPENAAVATMGFLIEALRELKQRARNNQLEFVVPQTYADYLPYIYFGKTRALFDGTATPDQNIYIQDMRKYMSWVELYERKIEVLPRAG